MAVEVRWLTAFIDRPSGSLEAVGEFWSVVTGTALGPWRGEHDEFATLLPTDGDAHLRIQRVDGTGGSHLDIHVDDVRAALDEAMALGAAVADDHVGFAVMRSPGGMAFCLVAHHGEAVRPRPTVIDRAGNRTRLDQLCIDVAPDRFDAEIEFFSALTGWPRRGFGRSDEFDLVVAPPTMPLRLLFQRRGVDDAGRPTRCHLDLSTDDIEATIPVHEALGASVVARRFWTVMSDPAGVEYCLTPRDPDTGAVAGS